VIGFNRWTSSSWANSVIAERALLAREDPAGEAEAILPLDAAESLITMVNWLAEHDAWQRRRQELPRSLRMSSHQGFDNEALLAALKAEPGAVHGIARCPAHADESPSLSWRIEADKLLLHCFAGCQWAEILESIGMVTA
jgi:hypothetical protein